ncbi:MAG TPA: alpha/beta hydrolase [Micromonosporaceae bacterium]
MIHGDRQHLPINGLQLYHEAHGDLGASETVPLLLIPGSFQSTDSMKQWVAACVAKRPVIVFDQQGHGRTAATPRTMSYEQFGDDAAVVLRALEIERADVMGYSQGGGVALQLALRRHLAGSANRTRWAAAKAREAASAA